MKKNLILGIAMAMGVTATAFANANPFSDVPAGSYVYAELERLQAAGIIEGYPDGTFKGDKLLTRYEAAQLVARAMSKGASNMDKMAAEFADELHALGVRVSDVEKKVDRVKITGQVRYSYASHSGDAASSGVGSKYNRFRTRIFVNSQINDSYSFTGMLENDRYFANQGADGSTLDNDKVTFKRAFIDGRLGGIKFSGGRKYFVQPDMIDLHADGLEARYTFGVVNATGWVMRNAESTFVTNNKAMEDRDRIYMAKVDTKVGAFKPAVSYWAIDNTYEKEPMHGNIWQAGFDVNLDKDLVLAANYYRGTAKDSEDYDRNGWGLMAKAYGAKASKPGSCGFWAGYESRPASTYIRPTALANYAYTGYDKGHTGAKSWFSGSDGYKGFSAGANWCVAKNIVATARYYDLKGRTGEGTRIRTVWTDVTFSF